MDAGVTRDGDERGEVAEGDTKRATVAGRTTSARMVGACVDTSSAPPPRPFNSSGDTLAPVRAIGNGGATRAPLTDALPAALRLGNLFLSLLFISGIGRRTFLDNLGLWLQRQTQINRKVIRTERR